MLFQKNKLLLLGDFNGHIGVLGEQKLNRNGKRVIDIIENFNLNLLNLDDKCNGELTWAQGEYNSVIDFVLANEDMYKDFVQMDIDENWEKLNISDHNLINILFMYGRIEKFTKAIETICLNNKSRNAINKYVHYVEENTSQLESYDMTKFNEIIKEGIEKHLKRTIKKKVKHDGSTEPMWITKEIKSEISKKREINKCYRKEMDNENKLILKKQVEEQKKKAQILVKNAIENYEIHISNKIMNDENRSKKIWEHIDTLCNNIKCNKEITMYSSNDQKLDKHDATSEIIEYWPLLYKKHMNKLIDNGDLKKDYELEFELQSSDYIKRIENISIENGTFEYTYYKTNLPDNLAEHFDAATQVNRSIKNMDYLPITIDEVKIQLKKLKNGKSPGPDTIRPEMYKYLLENKKVLETLTKTMNYITESGNIPLEWKTSTTKLIPKNEKPRVNVFRLIALTNISYKILMGILKNKIELHISETDNINDLQTGATKGRRVTENIFILQYCIEKSYIKKKELHVLSIDFQKAFDSIDRLQMIKVLHEFKINPKIVEIVI